MLSILLLSPISEGVLSIHLSYHLQVINPSSVSISNFNLIYSGDGKLVFVSDYKIVLQSLVFLVVIETEHFINPWCMDNIHDVEK